MPTRLASLEHGGKGSCWRKMLTPAVMAKSRRLYLTEGQGRITVLMVHHSQACGMEALWARYSTAAPRRFQSVSRTEPSQLRKAKGTGEAPRGQHPCGASASRRFKRVLTPKINPTVDTGRCGEGDPLDTFTSLSRCVTREERTVHASCFFQPPQAGRADNDLCFP
jgi:hypothetical protein